MTGRRVLTRRQLIGAAGGAAAVGVLGPSAASAAVKPNRLGGDLPLSRIGIQLFTVRDLLADNELDTPRTFQILRDAGYAELELGGDYDGRPSSEVRRIAEAHGLQVTSNHFCPRARIQNTWYDPNERGRFFQTRTRSGFAPSAPGIPTSVEGYKQMAAAFNGWGRGCRPQWLPLLLPPQSRRRVQRSTANRFSTSCSPRPTPATSSSSRPRLVVHRRRGPVPLHQTRPGPRPDVPRRGHSLEPVRTAGRRAGDGERRQQVLLRQPRKGCHRLPEDLLGAQEPQPLRPTSPSTTTPATMRRWTPTRRLRAIPPAPPTRPGSAASTSPPEYSQALTAVTEPHCP